MSGFMGNHLQDLTLQGLRPAAEAPRLRLSRITCTQKSRELLYRYFRDIICADDMKRGAGLVKAIDQIL
jgi:hypothetical protein